MATTERIATSERSDYFPYPKGILGNLLAIPLQLHRLGLGWLLRPFHLMVVSTKGRKSGQARHVVLEYRRHGSKVYVISAWGQRPHWLQNLQANPQVTIQIGEQEQAARAAIITDAAESLRALYMFQRSSPIYEAILAGMSGEENINLRKLKQVYNRFTIVRFDLLPTTPPLKGIRPTHRWLTWVVLSVLPAVLVWFVWRKQQNDIK